MINDKFSVSNADVKCFQSQGFLLLKGFFDPDTILHMKSLVGSNVKAPVIKSCNWRQSYVPFNQNSKYRAAGPQLCR